MHSTKQTRTVQQLADSMNVSRRMIFLAMELQRTGRGDLSAAVQAGHMSLAEALRIAKPEKYGAKRKSHLVALQRAWNGADASERDAMIEWLAEELGKRPG